MTHDEAKALFSAMWDKALAAEEQKALDEHLGACLVCRREYQEFESAVGAVGRLHRLPAPEGFARSLQERIHRRSGGRFFGPRRQSRVPYEIFSLVMLGIILAVYLFMQLAHPGLHVK